MWRAMIMGMLIVMVGCQSGDEVEKRDYISENRKAGDRVAAARGTAMEVVKGKVEEAGLSYPPGQVYLRGFKVEKELEVWGADEVGGECVLIDTIPVLAASGNKGPKRKEGDRQVPEGMYWVDLFNKKSSFHLSLGLDYPNRSDRIWGDPDEPGSDIFIHGDAVSIGCLALGDHRMEELFLLALDSSGGKAGKVRVDLFPERMEGEYEVGEDELSLYVDLQKAYAQFEETRVVPRFTIDEKGRYLVR